MKDQLRLVFELSRLDFKVEEGQSSLTKIETQRAERETQVQGQRQALETKSSEIAELEKGKREKEREVETAEARLQEFQKKLSQIKTNREYQAALKEISETKKSNKGLEDGILEFMMKIEALKKDQGSLEEQIQKFDETFEGERMEWDEEEKTVRETMGEIESKRQSIISQLDGKVAGLYHRIKKSRRDAVTYVEGGTCQGCYMHVPPQLYIEIQKSKAVHTCPSCHRILFLREWEMEGSPEITKEMNT